MFSIGTTVIPMTPTTLVVATNKNAQRTIWDILYELYQAFGPTTIIVIILIAGILILCYKMLEVFGTKFMESRLKGSFGRKKVDLTNHIALNKLDSIINYQVNSIHIECPLRSKIFKTIMQLRFKIIKDLMTDMSKKDWDISREVLSVIWDNFFANLETTWDREVDRLGVPKIVLTRFYDTRSDISKSLRDLTRNFCQRDDPDIKESVSIIFDIIVSIETSSLYIITSVLHSLNGELSNARFEGAECQSCANVDECRNREQ